MKKKWTKTILSYFSNLIFVEQDTACWVSSTVPRNGFNPTWEEETDFTINIPELAIVEFKVLLISLRTPAYKAVVGHVFTKRNCAVKRARKIIESCISIS